MLDAFIIEEIKRREEQRRRRSDRRPTIELPTDLERSDSDYDTEQKEETDESQTIVIDFGN